MIHKIKFIVTAVLLFLSACNNAPTAPADPTSTVSSATATSTEPILTPTGRISTPTPFKFPIKEVYSPGQAIDIYLPQGEKGPFPVVFALHGGGGTKNEFSTWAKNLTKKGYALVAPNYRGSPGKDLNPEQSQYPISLQDSACALAWVYANAETYSLDTQRVSLLGFSLGGTISAQLAVSDDLQPYLQECKNKLQAPIELQGVITLSAEFDYQQKFRPEVMEWLNAYLGKTYENDPDLWKNASPITHISGNEPPFLLMQGKDDEWIATAQASNFEKTLKNAGVSATVVFLPGDHLAMIKSNKSQEIASQELSKWFEN